jgi:CheY-like chemotaxis protein
MLLRSFRFLMGAALLLAALSYTAARDGDKDKEKPKPPPKKPGPPPIDEVRPGEEYRQFFKKPTNVPEYWAAMKFELEVGKKDLAALLLHGMLGLNPSNEDLVKIEEEDGMVAFLRLRNIRPWVPAVPVDEKPFQKEIARLKASEDLEALDKIGKVNKELEDRRKEYQDAVDLNEQAYKDTEELIKLVNTAVKKHLSDPVRINKFVQNLKASPEEREYALKELFRSGALVAPYLLNELRRSASEDRAPIMAALTRLSDDIVPAILAALDADNPVFLSDLIDVLVKRKAGDAVPHLWYLSASSSYPQDIRRKATMALSGFLNEVPSRLVPAKASLVREAERYYSHEVKFADPRAVPLWRWDGKIVTLTVLPATKVEEYYGTKYAGLALKLDPSYQPAQVALLNMVLEKTYEQAGLAKPLSVSAPEVHDLLATTSPELLVNVLERALNERHTSVVLGAIRTLGGMSDVRASRPQGSGPAPLVRALNYPDRRVQFAAAEALLNIPGPALSQQTTRIVDLLRRFIAAEPAAKGVPRVLVGHFTPDIANRISDAVRLAGYEPVIVHSGREMMRRVLESADIDLILMDEALPDPGMTSLLAQLRADRNAGQIPILLTVHDRVREDKLRQFLRIYKNVTVIPGGFALDARDLKVVFEQRIVDPGTAPLTPDEMVEYREKSIYWLARLARGEIAGFDVRPTLDVVANALRANTLSPGGQMSAVEVVARIPGEKAQLELATVVLDGKDPVVRLAATRELIRHIQKHRLALKNEVVARLAEKQTAPDTDPTLRASLALIVGSMRPDSRTTGERLLQFQPPIPQAPPLPAVPEK